ncbi:MAG: hypothetical protein Q7S92_00415 [Candidatus Diapherotrites archaeon]|nr:hypothetical protein [Candidatus Diapherotrites archaeon]
MNSKGNLFIFALLGFIVVAAIPPLIMMFFPAADIIMRLILIFTLYSTVKGYLGSGMIPLLLSAILIYLLVIKHAFLTTSIFVFFYVLLAFNFLSVIIWGLNIAMMVTKRH